MTATKVADRPVVRRKHTPQIKHHLNTRVQTRCPLINHARRRKIPCTRAQVAKASARLVETAWGEQGTEVGHQEWTSDSLNSSKASPRNI